MKWLEKSSLSDVYLKTVYKNLKMQTPLHVFLCFNPRFACVQCRATDTSTCMGNEKQNAKIKNPKTEVFVFVQHHKLKPSRYQEPEISLIPVCDCQYVTLCAALIHYSYSCHRVCIYIHI